MPYIKQEDRKLLDPIIDQFPKLKIGEIPCIFLKVLEQFMEDNGVNYAKLSAAGATLSDCRDEFQRQIVNPFLQKLPTYPSHYYPKATVYMVEVEKKKFLGSIVEQFPELTVGEMNYIYTRIVHGYIKNQGKLCRDDLLSIVKMFTDCRNRFNAEIVAPYEDKKKAENGAISGLDKAKEDIS